MREEILEEIGLSKNESKIFLALNKMGTAPAGEISEKSKVHRTNVYDALERLIKKGLVSYIIKEDKKIFTVNDPSNLLNLMQEKEAKLKSILPELILNHQLSQIKTRAQIFEGIHAFRTILYDLLKFKESILVYGIPVIVPEILKNFIMAFHKERIKKKVNMNHIYNSKAKTRVDILNNMEFTGARMLPKEYDAPASTLICGNIVLVILWDAEPFLFIQIENKHLADAYKRYFEIMWNLAKE